MQVQESLSPGRRALLPVQHVNVRFISRYGPFSRTWAIFYPSLLLHMAEFLEAEPRHKTSLDLYETLTDTFSLVCLAGLLPLLHEVQCAIKALQQRNLYLPDLMRVLQGCQARICELYITSASAFGRDTSSAFKAYTSLSCVLSELDESDELFDKRCSGFELRKCGARDAERTLHYVVYDIKGSERGAFVMTQPGRGKNGRPGARVDVVESNVSALFAKAEVRATRRFPYNRAPAARAVASNAALEAVLTKRCTAGGAVQDWQGGIGGA